MGVMGKFGFSGKEKGWFGFLPEWFTVDKSQNKKRNVDYEEW